MMQTLTHNGRTVLHPSRELAKVIPCCPTCGAPVVWSGSPGREIVECIDLRCGFQAIRKPESEEDDQDLEGGWLLIIRLFMVVFMPPALALALAFTTLGGCIYIIWFPVHLICDRLGGQWKS